MSLELAKRLLHLPPPRAALRALFNGLAKKLATFQSRRVQWPSSRHEGDRPLACPFFLPSEKFDDGGWLHPSRLPLGGGWRGVCTASSQAATVPVDEQLKEFCNLGYAATCPHLPPERPWDAVRFSVTRDCEDRIFLDYVCERSHRPMEHGSLEYVFDGAQWIQSHRDARIQKMAECYLDSYLHKTSSRKSVGVAVGVSS